MRNLRPLAPYPNQPVRGSHPAADLPEDGGLGGTIAQDVEIDEPDALVEPRALSSIWEIKQPSGDRSPEYRLGECRMLCQTAGRQGVAVTLTSPLGGDFPTVEVRSSAEKSRNSGLSMSCRAHRRLAWAAQALHSECGQKQSHQHQGPGAGGGDGLSGFGGGADVGSAARACGAHCADSTGCAVGACWAGFSIWACGACRALRACWAGLRLRASK